LLQYSHAGISVASTVDLVESFTYLGSTETSDGYCRSDIARRIGLACTAMSSLNNICNTKHLSIQTKVCVYQTLVLSILLYASETWTLLASDMKAVESFHMKCQRRILGIRWHDFVPNSEVTLRTGLTPVSDCITIGRNAIFGHVARMPDNTPAHQAMLCQVKLSVGRPPDPSWKRPLGQPLTKWTDQLRHNNNNVPIATLWTVEASHWSRSLESDTTVQANYTLTTTTTMIHSIKVIIY